MRTILLILLSSILPLITNAQSLGPSNATAVVGSPLPKVQAAIEAYYKPTTNGNGNWGRSITTVSNAVGESGIAFRICNCMSMPVCYEIRATIVNSNSTRLRVDVDPMYLSEALPYPEHRFNRAKRILDGVGEMLAQQR